MTFPTRAVALFAIVSLAGCTYYPVEGDLTPVRIQVVSGDGQSRSAGLPVRLPLTVQVTDARGAPVADAEVAFVARGSAIAAPAVVRTNQAGFATAGSWSLRLDGGEDTLTARLANGLSASFTATSLVFTQISIADGASCALATGGIAACWGQNQSGNLGTGDFADALRPTLSGAGRRFSRITTNQQLTCGVGLDSLVYCAGWAGQGLPDPEYRENGGGHLFIDVVPSFRVICGIGVDRKGYCWGPWLNGADPNDPNQPLEFPSSSHPPIVAISSKWYSSPFDAGAYFCALNAQGEAHCYNPAFFPSEALSPPPGMLFEQVSTATPAACGLRASEVWCWGNVIGWGLDGSKAPIPFASAIAGGPSRICAIALDGVYCFGPGTTRGRVPGSERHHFIQLAVALDHSCGLEPNGEVWCWGQNSVGQLGDGTRQDSPTPVRVRPDL